MEDDARELVELLWRLDLNAKVLFNGDPATDLNHDTYYEYYSGQWHLIADYSDGRYFALKTGTEVRELIQQIQAGKTREDLIASLQSRGPAGPSEEACNNAINLASRLLLMLKFGAIKHQAIPRRYLNWTTGSLEEFVKEYFGQPPLLNVERVKLPRAFNAWAIATIGGIAIEFTDNLADHLLLVEDDSKLKIFHHASFLECQEG
jgi:hypothetical protein